MRPPPLLDTAIALRCFVAFTRLVDGFWLSVQQRRAIKLADEFRVQKASDGKSWIVEARCREAYEARRFDLPSLVVHDAKSALDALYWAFRKAGYRRVRYMERP